MDTPPPNGRPSTKVIAIVGYTRSGSTLLDSILGQIPGFFSTGELHYLWERGLIEGRRCGCGQPITSCEVWIAAMERAYDGRPPEPRDVMRWQDASVRTRHTWGLLRGGTRPVDGNALDAYRPVIGSLYRGIAEATGAHVIVDSSKRPSDAAILRLLDTVDPYIVHLVRDPRAVAYSWRRPKRELDHDAVEEMPLQSPLRSAIEWSQQNVAADALRRKVGAGRSMLVRYEDLMHRPRSTVAAIVALVGEHGAAVPFDDEHTVRLGGNHTVSGNPGRFSSGSTRLQSDEEWRTRIARADLLEVTAVTLPLLVRYGYRVGVRRGAGG